MHIKIDRHHYELDPAEVKAAMLAKHAPDGAFTTTSKPMVRFLVEAPACQGCGCPMDDHGGSGPAHLRAASRFTRKGRHVQCRCGTDYVVMA